MTRLVWEKQVAFNIRQSMLDSFYHAGMARQRHHRSSIAIEIMGGSTSSLSPHGYDPIDYSMIDPRIGTLKQISSV
ncbi:hypothetical protein [Pantanalinema sp. GBBB05]|uniref:hypothetical protein n=1 Tax=Pantanalinema sp. GBBB05 TaxID=2604139 RepID=UPI001D1BDD47|nr:hypothetical protein [Pantanalinema sp. GBBB05]